MRTNIYSTNVGAIIVSTVHVEKGVFGRAGVAAVDDNLMARTDVGVAVLEAELRAEEQEASALAVRVAAIGNEAIARVDAEIAALRAEPV